jgi:hypothetical protein
MTPEELFVGKCSYYINHPNDGVSRCFEYFGNNMEKLTEFGLERLKVIHITLMSNYGAGYLNNMDQNKQEELCRRYTENDPILQIIDKLIEKII